MNVIEMNDEVQGDRANLDALAEQIAEETASQTSNGNREKLEESKPGSAQTGGPDIDKARDRQPPDATRPRETNHH